MNKLFKNTLVILVFSTSLFSLQAQDDTNTDGHEVSITIPEVAILDVEPTGGSFSLAPEKPSEAGLALDFTNSNNDDLWLNYSSIVGATTDPSRTIDVKIQDGDDVPDGLLLKVTAGADNGTGDGVMGSPTGQLTLSNTAQKIITGIGSCYTGSPEKNGHQLTYALELDGTAGSYGKIDFDQSTTLRIVYTITE